MPLKMRPNRSVDTGAVKGLPVKRTRVFCRDRPTVSPKSSITASSWPTARTRPVWREPSGAVTSTLSSKPTPRTPVTTRSGPIMLLRPRYSRPERTVSGFRFSVFGLIVHGFRFSANSCQPFRFALCSQLPPYLVPKLLLGNVHLGPSSAWAPYRKIKNSTPSKPPICHSSSSPTRRTFPTRRP